jgi:peptidoglycan/LPS O-acetylase OafA/YrhL
MVYLLLRLILIYKIEMRKKVFILILFLAILSLPVMLYSQPPSGQWNPPDEDPTVPIDGGLALLIGGGASYFFFKFFKNRRLK